MENLPQTIHRTCKKCGATGSVGQMFECINRERDWYRGVCRRCTNERVRDWWYRTPDLAKARARRQYEARKDMLATPEMRTRINNRVRYRVALLQQQVYVAYGNACRCCGESNPLFFTIDHVQNDGHLTRNGRGGAGADLYRQLIRNGFPDTFQLLCFNCNLGKARNGGTCPHQDK